MQSLELICLCSSLTNELGQMEDHGTKRSNRKCVRTTAVRENSGQGDVLRKQNLISTLKCVQDQMNQ